MYSGLSPLLRLNLGTDHGGAFLPIWSGRLPDLCSCWKWKLGCSGRECGTRKNSGQFYCGWQPWRILGGGVCVLEVWGCFCVSVCVCCDYECECVCMVCFLRLLPSTQHIPPFHFLKNFSSSQTTLHKSFLPPRLYLDLCLIFCLLIWRRSWE